MFKKAHLLSLAIFLLSIIFISYSSNAEARSSKSHTFGVMGIMNVQLFDTEPELSFGGGGGIFYDYRFNQKFSITTDLWISFHDGEGSSNGDDGIKILGVPNTTIKYYFLGEGSSFDPYIGLGIGVYALTEGDVENGTDGFGIGAQIELGLDYYFNDTFSVGFSGIFRSAGIIHNLDGNNDSATALVPFSLFFKGGYHF